LPRFKGLYLDAIWRLGNLQTELSARLAYFFSSANSAHKVNANQNQSGWRDASPSAAEQWESSRNLSTEDRSAEEVMGNSLYAEEKLVAGAEQLPAGLDPNFMGDAPSAVI
jgi:hypothetical protein